MRRLVIAIVALAVAAVLAGALLLERLRLDDETIVIAHRGAAAFAPENTLAAFERAIEDGADYIELDVQETADGEVIVLHDSDFMKLAGVPLKIWDANYAQLGDIDIGSWYAPEFSNERVPTLRQVLEECKGRVRVVIELKYYGHDQRLEERVVEIIEETGMAANVILMSLDYDGVRKLKALRPDWTVGLLAAKAVGNLTNVDADFLAVNAGMGTRRFLRQARGANKPVYLWTVNDAAQMSRFMSMGFDGIITDDPAQARAVLERRAELNVAERLVLSLIVWAGGSPPAYATDRV
jgi:glycerophosphoryl diester phosphodiesterase